MIPSGSTEAEEHRYTRPEVWSDPDRKLFRHQVGFTCPPHDFDAAPSDFLRTAPPSVGVHGRMMYAPVYAHGLSQRADNFHLLEEFARCMADNGADVVGQVGSNWVHCNGTDAADIRLFYEWMVDTYGMPFHVAGMTLVEAACELGAEKVALTVYYWPDWRDGLNGFLRSVGLDVVYAGNFVDLGIFDDQKWVNAQRWIFDGEVAVESVVRTVERAPDAEVVHRQGHTQLAE